jgi:hypothetical protein
VRESVRETERERVCARDAKRLPIASLSWSRDQKGNGKRETKRAGES